LNRSIEVLQLSDVEELLDVFSLLLGVFTRVGGEDHEDVELVDASSIPS